MTLDLQTAASGLVCVDPALVDPALIDATAAACSIPPSWWEFITSPGAGGVAALVAAIIAFTGILIKNAADKAEGARDRAQDASLAKDAEDARRWWELAGWTWTNRIDLGTTGVLEMLSVLEEQAHTAEQRTILAGIVTGLRDEGKTGT